MHPRPGVMPCAGRREEAEREAGAAQAAEAQRLGRESAVLSARLAAASEQVAALEARALHPGAKLSILLSRFFVFLQS